MHSIHIYQLVKPVGFISLNAIAKHYRQNNCIPRILFTKLVELIETSRIHGYPIWR